MIESHSSVMHQPSPFKPTVTGLASCKPETARFVVTFLRYLQATEQLLADSLTSIAKRNAITVDVHDLCLYLARYSYSNAASLAPFIQHDAQVLCQPRPAEGVRSMLLDGGHLKEMTLLMELQDMALLVNQAKLGWTISQQIAMTLRDQDLMQAAAMSLDQTRRQLHWLESYIKLAALQAAMLPAQ